MMSLVTRCPKCLNDFLATLEQLRVHNGLVRCGTCSNIFDAYSHLESDLPVLTRRAHEAQASDYADNARDNAPTAVKDSYFTPAETFNEPFVQEAHQKEPEPSVLRQRGQAGYAPNSSFGQTYSEPVFSHDEPGLSRTTSGFSHTEPLLSHSEPVLSQGEPALSIVVEPRASVHGTESLRRRQPEFLHESEGTGLVLRVFWSVACLFALIALLAQSIYIYRNDIATRLPFVQPVLNSLCAKLNCDVSLSRHLERISIDASSLQQSPGQTQEGRPVELSLRFTMRNRYDKNQPWPHLSLELKDASGTTVVRKIIAPHQYLPPTQVDQPFAAGQEVNLLIPVAVNGLQINGFQLDKFFP